MMEALGLKVVRLMRIAIGNVRLPSNLLPGKMRPVTEQEKKYLQDLKKCLDQEAPAKKRLVKSPLSEKELLERKAKKAKVSTEGHYAKEIVERQKKIQTLSRKRKETLGVNKK